MLHTNVEKYSQLTVIDEDIFGYNVWKKKPTIEKRYITDMQWEYQSNLNLQRYSSVENIIEMEVEYPSETTNGASDMSNNGKLLKITNRSTNKEMTLIKRSCSCRCGQIEPRNTENQRKRKIDENSNIVSFSPKTKIKEKKNERIKKIRLISEYEKKVDETQYLLKNLSLS